ncbi:mandelate racemase/muconate lactonizing enzyme family protein [Agreia sp. Leaf283]|uniref:mandelate racemase/muconate lactonizing enzyme family protein n=1 Tax=Agreia sp. Leaf283 TaxID=1736321 RepID=UPI000700094B|nr:mandelate racemase/muconate lactonizing enzyme family protein [Agreia sp. Leaf283]KQP56856.1 racemase [Agreia sp. Leaf283]
MTATIAAVRTRRLSARMPRPWVPDEPHLHLVIVEVEDSDGLVGTGFSWTPTIGAAAVQAMIDTEIAPYAIGRTTDPQALWPALWLRLHEAGGAGITTIALAGLDTALWDLSGKRAALPLASLLGERRASVPVYGSGVNLHYPLDELVAQASRWVASGYDTVKIKVGGPSLAVDIERVGAVREAIGPDRTLLIDANQRWTLEQATTALDALSRFDLGWIEEPLRAEDTRGYRALRERTGVPIALGENIHTLQRFQDIVDAGFADVLQPNIIRVGGITPFLEIASFISTESSASLAPHLLIDLSGQLALAVGAETAVEDVDEASFESLGLITSPSPVEIVDARARLREDARPGLGLDFACTGISPTTSASLIPEES